MIQLNIVLKLILLSINILWTHLKKDENPKITLLPLYSLHISKVPGSQSPWRKRSEGHTEVWVMGGECPWDSWENETLVPWPRAPTLYHNIPVFSKRDSFIQFSQKKIRTFLYRKIHHPVSSQRQMARVGPGTRPHLNRFSSVHRGPGGFWSRNGGRRVRPPFSTNFASSDLNLTLVQT